MCLFLLQELIKEQKSLGEIDATIKPCLETNVIELVLPHCAYEAIPNNAENKFLFYYCIKICCN